MTKMTTNDDDRRNQDGHDEATLTSPAINNNNGVVVVNNCDSTVQQLLERLALRHPSLLTRGRNFLQTRHIKEEGFDLDVTINDGGDGDDGDGENSIADIMELRYLQLFNSFARVVCKSKVIPRKELFETFGMALYVHHHFFAMTNLENEGSTTSEVRRVVDLACSHGLLSWALMLLRDLDDQIRREKKDQISKAIFTGQKSLHHEGSEDREGSPHIVCKDSQMRPCSAICVDRSMPPSSEKLAIEFQNEWPDLAERWDYVEGMIMQVQPSSTTLLVGVHCCGQLSDQVIDLAIRGNSPLALVPCCHTHKCLSTDHKKDLREFKQRVKEEQQKMRLDKTEMKTPMALGDSLKEKDATVDDITPSTKFLNANTTLTDFIDNIRIERLRDAGFDVQEARIPEEFSPKNRIILATPPKIPIPERILRQSKYHMEMKPAVTLFNIPFDIPVADTEEARKYIRSVSGRAAANQRRRRLPPSLTLALQFPEPDFLSMEQIHDFADKIVSRYGPMVVEELTESEQNNPARLPVLFQHRPQQDDGLKNDPQSNVDNDSGNLKFKIRVEHAGKDREKEGGYAQTYKIEYGIDDESGTMPQITKTQAKALHVILYRQIPNEFGDNVKVRQHLQKDIPKLATILSRLL